MEGFNEPTHGNDDVFASVLETHSIYRASTEVYYKNSNRKKTQKALCWIVIGIMSVLIRVGPVALLW